MESFLNIFLTVFDFMKNTTFLSFSIGETAISITLLQVAIGGFIAVLGIDVLHNIFDW